MRKLIIAAVAVAVVGIGFWVYVSMMDSAPNLMPTADESDDITMPDTESRPQKVGDVVPGEIEDARYYKYDPVTKQPVAEYGFRRMLNPGQGRSRWELEKPYIIYYKPDFQCRMESDRGIFQMDPSSVSEFPKDAQLEKNVKIHILPTPGSSVSEAVIYMDDLVFSSERSEFTTDGPVRIDSPQIQMDGFGLIFIFNTAAGRIEYLQLRDLDYLRVKELAKSPTPPDEGKPAEIRAAAADTPTATADTQPHFYLCTIEDNVEIRYGNELIVSGADQVNIQNINFSKTDNPSAESASAEGSSEPTEAVAAASDTPKEPREVVVKCDGGIVIQPMPKPSKAEAVDSEPDLALEMSGAPLRIDRIVSASLQESQPLAHCGLLTYRPAEDVLRLFTSPLQPEILLNAEESHGRIQTRGNVFWDRKGRHANIAGPGTVTIGNARQPGVRPSEINFNMMDLMFARLPQEVSAPSIEAINLTGGMDAVLRQNGTFKTRSDEAVLQFGNENEIAQAKLTGDVHLESLDPDKLSQAASQSAVFHFADNQIARADLDGDVRFASNDGRFASAEAVVEFQPDAGGTMQPKVLKTAGQAVMETVSKTAQPPAKFEAQKIDYDLETGSGLAYGPIRVTYYEKADSDTSLDAWVPMTISADDDAQFFADPNRSIRRVVMRDNVVASQLIRTTEFTRRDQMHGDRLEIHFGTNAAGEMMLQDVAVSEGKVFVQSTKTRNEAVLFNVKLDCQRLDYTCSGLTEEIAASGPGEIQLNNSEVAPSEKPGKGLDLNRPCIAYISNFDTLRWNMMDLTIAADAPEDKPLQMTYVPIKDGLEEKYVHFYSQQMNVGFLMNSPREMELKNVFTDKGIVVEEADMFNNKVVSQFRGQTMNYDMYTDPGWLTITGTDAYPANVNGMSVQKIRYNVNTGQLDAAMSSTPGVIGN